MGAPASRRLLQWPVAEVLASFFPGFLKVVGVFDVIEYVERLLAVLGLTNLQLREALIFVNSYKITAI